MPFVHSSEGEYSIRSAGLLEKFSIYRERLGLYGPLVVSGTYDACGTQEYSLDETTLIKILKHCIVQHSVLSAVIPAPDSEAPPIERASYLNLNNHFQIMKPSGAKDISTQEALERIHNDAIDDRRPGWKVYVVSSSPMPSQRFRLFFAYSHALADGRSGLLFHKSFLHALRIGKHLPFDADPIFAPRVFHIAPALEKTATFTISEGLLRATKNCGTPKPGIWTGHWTGCGHIPGIASRTAVEVEEIPSEIVGNALVACREHGSKLTGLLTHAVAHALGRALHARGCNVETLMIDTSFDMRRAIGQGQEAMANYPSNMREAIQISPEGPGEYPKMTDEGWEAVKQRTQALNDRATSLADHLPMLLGYLKTQTLREFISNLAKSQTGASVAICNIGVFDVETDVTNPAGWTVDEIRFSQSSNVTTAPLMFNFTSSKGGSMAIVVSWWPGMLGVEDERSFVKDVCAGITCQFLALSA